MVSDVKNSTSSSIITAMDQRMVKLEKSPAVSATEQGGTGETLKLTDLASRLRDLTQSVADVPMVDKQRVDQFQQAVNDGSYRVDAQQVAEKLYGFESMMTGAPGRS